MVLFVLIVMVERELWTLSSSFCIYGANLFDFFLYTILFLYYLLFLEGISKSLWEIEIITFSLEMSLTSRQNNIFPFSLVLFSDFIVYVIIFFIYFF